MVGRTAKRAGSTRAEKNLKHGKEGVWNLEVFVRLCISSIRPLVHSLIIKHTEHVPQVPLWAEPWESGPSKTAAALLRWRFQRRERQGERGCTKLAHPPPLC